MNETINQIIWCDNPNYPQVMHTVLYRIMAQISEDWYAASWMIGLDITLFKHMREHPNDLDSRILKTLSDQIGGWIVWADDGENISAGPEFVPWHLYNNPSAEQLAQQSY